MNLLKTITAALAGTSMMTLFSYQVSENRNKQFKEPVLLTKAANKLVPADHKINSTLPAWILHYSVGFLFSAVYDRIWQKTRMNPTLFNGLLLGGVSGVIGAEVWKTILKLHPNPPKVDLKKYYNHLIVAHIIFGFFAASGYKAVN